MVSLCFVGSLLSNRTVISSLSIRRFKSPHSSPQSSGSREKAERPFGGTETTDTVLPPNWLKPELYICYLVPLQPRMWTFFSLIDIKSEKVSSLPKRAQQVQRGVRTWAQGAATLTATGPPAAESAFNQTRAQTLRPTRYLPMP